MGKYSAAYIVAGVRDSLHNFSNTRFYLFSHDLDFLVNKDVLVKAEFYGVGEPKMGDDQRKLAALKALGRLLRVGTFKVIWKNHLDPEISELKFHKGELADEEKADFMARLVTALRKQYDSFHDPQDRGISYSWAFSEVDRAYPLKSDPKVYYFRKTLIPIEPTFSEDGFVLPTFSDAGNLQKHITTSGLFRISQHLAFEFSTWHLLSLGKSEQKVTFSGDGGVKKLEIIRLLAEAGGALVKSDLIETLWLQDSLGRYGEVSRPKERKFNTLVDGIRDRLRSYVNEEEAKGVIVMQNLEVSLSRFIP